jgi:hypothetical protein
MCVLSLLALTIALMAFVRNSSTSVKVIAKATAFESLYGLKSSERMTRSIHTFVKTANLSTTPRSTER